MLGVVMVLILSRTDLERVLTMSDTISVLEEAFREQTRGGAAMPTRVSLSIPKEGGWMGVMPAYLENSRALSTKIVTVFDQNASRNLPTIMATVLLCDPTTGGLVAIMDGSFITAFRTGGLGGLAAKYLSREDAHTVGILGAGVQARTQLMALVEVRSITHVKVYDIISERAAIFAREMKGRLRIEVEASPAAEDAIRHSDIVVTVSTSRNPLFDGDLVQPGTHINAFGNFKPNERELDSKTVKKSKVFVDLREAAFAEAGDLILPIQEGSIDKGHILGEIGEVLIGSKRGRTSSEDITLFKSVGVGIQDCAVASLAYRKAKESGLGTEVSLD
jgi:alanine dehydrogenase